MSGFVEENTLLVVEHGLVAFIPSFPTGIFTHGGGGASVTTKYHACLFHSLYLNAR